MTRSRRGRTVWLCVVIGLTTLAGCATVATPDCNRTRGGFLSGTVVERLPENATVVNATAESLADAAIVRRVVNQTAETGSGYAELEPAESCRVRDRLAAAAPEENGWELYVRHGSVVVRLRLAFST